MLSRVWSGIRGYVRKLAHFRRNAWLYLLNAVIAGVTLGIFGLLSNFYARSLGYSNDLARCLQVFLSHGPLGTESDTPLGKLRGA